MMDKSNNKKLELLGLKINIYDKNHEKKIHIYFGK